MYDCNDNKYEGMTQADQQNYRQLKLWRCYDRKTYMHAIKRLSRNKNINEWYSKYIISTNISER
jgi:hypothetical protein